MTRTGFAQLSLLAVSFTACQGSVGGDKAENDLTPFDPREPSSLGGRGGSSTEGAGGNASNPSGGSPAMASTPIPNLPLPPIKGTGILDCPAVAYPGTLVVQGVEEVAKLPSTYGTYCAACHGAAGEGRTGYPALTNTKLSSANFASTVRVGKGNMPKFDAAIMSDGDVQGIFAKVTQKATGGSLVTQHPALSWTAAQIEDKRAKGLAAFRHADERGEACSNCHAPDGIDLAVLAYPDEAILRRAGLHLPPDQALVVLDFIHAQRRHYNITQPCSTDWRPFQPGGKVLAGKTDQEQDESFWLELRQRNILVSTKTIETEAESATAWKQLADLNMRMLPNGIPLPRWTEDSFDGAEHKSLNDWIPSVPRVPKDGEFLKRFDEYVANPTLEGISSLAEQLTTLTHDNGFSEIKTGGYRPTFQEFFMTKYRSVLIASHYFRMAALGRKGWFEDFQMAPSPMAVISNGQMINPMQAVGFLFQEDNCFADDACRPAEFAALPSLAKLEVGADAKTFKEPLLPTLSHAWWSLATLLDPVLAQRPFKRTNPRPTVHYWMGHFSQRDIHRPFYTALINVKRSEAMSASTPGNKVHPLLEAALHSDGDRTNLFDDSSNRLSHVFLQHNLLRMELLEMRRALKASGSVSDRGSVRAEVARIATWVDSRLSNNDLIARATDLIDFKALKASMSSTTTLATEVKKLIDAAPQSSN